MEINKIKLSPCLVGIFKKFFYQNYFSVLSICSNYKFYVKNILLGEHAIEKRRTNLS